jgi:hypothetical protein
MLYSYPQASRRCKINYSTAKILLRDLTPKERSFIKVLIRQKEEQEEMKENFSRECGHVIIDSPSEHESPISNKIEVVSRVAFDFFNLSQQ